MREGGGWNEGMEPLTLILGTICQWLVSITLQLLYLYEGVAGTQ
jgi:hypothetical protein